MNYYSLTPGELAEQVHEELGLSPEDAERFVRIEGRHTGFKRAADLLTERAETDRISRALDRSLDRQRQAIR